MQIQENFSLTHYNTFGIDVKSRYIAAIANVAQLAELITQYSHVANLILGGGSNILFARDIDGLVLKNEIKGIEKIKEDLEHIYVRVGAGENWHQFVMFCIQNNW